MPRSFTLHPFYLVFLAIVFILVPAYVGFLAISDGSSAVFFAILIGLVTGLVFSVFRVTYHIVVDIDVVVLKRLTHTTKIRFNHITSLRQYHPTLSRNPWAKNLSIITDEGSYNVPLWNMFHHRNALASLLEKKTGKKIES